MGLEQTDRTRRPRLAVGAVGDDRREADPAHAAPSSAAEVAAARVEEVGAAAGHAGPEVRADRAEHDDRPAGHVLAAVRADALDDGLGATVADGEAHPGPADEVEPAAGRAVQDGVAGDGLRRGSAASSGSGTTVIDPPDRPLPT